MDAAVAAEAALRLLDRLRPPLSKLVRLLGERRVESAAVAISLVVCIAIAYALGG